MRQVLILTYFYPPCNLTASQRPASWAKYLPEFGYSPTVVTRSWEIPIAEPLDVFRASGMAVRVERTGGHEVHSVPYRPSLRDRVYTRFGEERLVRTRRVLSLVERLGEHACSSAVSYRGILREARSVVEARASLDRIVVTGGPFTMFRFGHDLVRRYPRLRWVADYRDDWTSTPLVPNPSGLEAILRRIERFSEKRWVRTATHITSAIDGYLRRVTRISGRPGSVVMNGFDEETLSSSELRAPAGVFRIVHAGSLYPSQPIEIFFEGVASLIRQWREQIRVEVHFPGLAFSPAQARRVQGGIQAFGDRFVITPRRPHAEVIELQRSSHVLLLVAHQGLRDIAPSKLYEYIGLRKPVLLCPTDDGVMRSTLEPTGLGLFANSPGEVVRRLAPLVARVHAGQDVGVRPREEAVRRMSRREQAKKLAAVLDEL